MSTGTWYVLVPKGSTEFSDDLMGLIELEARQFFTSKALCLKK
jgi:hypothetical protein